VQDRAITVIPGRRMAASPESIFQRPVRMFSAAGVHGFRAASLRSAPGMTKSCSARSRPWSSFRGALAHRRCATRQAHARVRWEGRRARNPFSRGGCSWIPGCRAALGPRN